MRKYLISGYNNIQETLLDVGVYTLVVYVKSMFGSVYTFSLFNGTEWESFDIDVIKGEWCKVYRTFEITEKKTKFNPIHDNYSSSKPVFVHKMQLSKGNLPSESGASPFDIDQILDDLHDEIDGIEDFTNKAFADGILDKTERIQLRSSLEYVETIVESVRGSYDKIVGIDYIPNTIKKPVNPYISIATADELFDRYSDLIRRWEGSIQTDGVNGLKTVIINILEDDNIVDATEIAQKDLALSAFNSALYNYNQAEKEVYNSIGDDYSDKIDEAIIKATYWVIDSSSPVIYKDASDVSIAGYHTPVVVRGELRRGDSVVLGGFITITPNGSAEGTATASPRTIAPTNAEGKTSYTARLYEKADKVKLLDTMTIPVVFKGASGVNAINAILSNEADVLPASPEGVVSDYAGSGTIIRVFEGATELTYGTGNGQYQVSASGSGINVGTSSTVGNTRVYGVASSMTSDNATITFTISGKISSGASFSLTKVQTFAKSRVGQKGKDAIAPIIIDGFWAFWDSELQEFVPSEFSAIGDDGHAPIIRDGYWYEWNPESTEEDKYEPTGVRAEGKDGEDAYSITLSKESHTYSYDKNGNLKGLLSDGATIISVQKGNTFIECDTTSIGYDPVNNNTYRVIDIELNGVAYNAYSRSLTGNQFRIYPSNITSFPASMTFTVKAKTNGEFSKDLKKTISFGQSYDGKEGAGTETIYILGNTYPSTPSGNNPSGWVKFPLTPTKSQKYVYVSTRSKPEGGVWGAWSSPAVYTIFIEALDAAVPAVSYMDGEWAIGRTFIRDDYSFPLVTYLKGTGDRPLFYYLNKKGTYFASSIADSPQNNSSGANPLWRYVENVDMLISDSVFTGMLKLSDSNFLETAGGSGHTGVMGTLPALWAGGTYNEAKRLMNLLDAIRYGGNPVGKTANFVVNHSGAAKLGIFVIDQSGRVNLIDPMSGNPFGYISNHPIPLYSDMLLNEYSGSSAMNLEKTFWYNDNNILLPNSVTTVRAGGDIEFTATATFSGSIPVSGSAYVELILRRNGVYYQTIYSDFFESKKVPVGTPSLDFTNTVEINEKLIDVPYGAYDILFKSEYIMAANSCKLELSESFLVWTYTPKDSKTVQIGKNGFMAWFGADKHIHLSDTEGLKIKGIAADSVTGAITTAFARVASNAAMSGSTSYLRAGLSLHSSKSSIGKYRLSHNLNKLKYVCHVTPTQAARSASIILQDSYYIDIEFRNEMGDLSDSSFSFSIIELNN